MDPCKIGRVFEVRSSLPRGPGSDALQRPGDAIDPFGHLYVLQHDCQLQLAQVLMLLLVSYCR